MTARLWTLLLAAAIAATQRDPANNGALVGVVVRANTNEPIEDVRIELKAESLNRGGAAPAVQLKPVMTDRSGRFEFRNLPPGRYRVHWQRSGYFHPSLDGGGAFEDGPYITTGGGPHPRLNVSDFYRSRNRDERSIAVDLVENQTAAVQLPLLPGGVITGRVQDERGRPLAGASIVPFRVERYELGEAVLLRNHVGATVDDRGEYRLFGLQPGRYFLRASFGKKVSYYPGGAEGRARAITVNSGSESRDISFGLQEEPAVIVSGSVTVGGRTSLETPVEKLRWLMFFLVSTGGGPLDTERLRFHNAVSGSAELLAGKFEVPGVRPGDYDMYVLLDNEDDALPDVDYLAAHQRITVGSSGLQSVSVGIGAAASRITGRLVLVDGAKLDPKSKLDVFAQPMAAVYPDIKGLTRGATVNPDGAFEISGLLDHHYLVTLSGLPPGVAVADIRQGGRSALDDGIAAGGGSEPMEIVVTGSAGTVRVNARDANGQPVKNATVTLVPTGDRSRYFTERTRSGHSQIEGVLPGEYVLFAWDDIPDGAELNADFMREYEAHGVRILVEPRQSIAVDVPLVSTEDTVWLSGAAGCSETQ